MSTTLKCEYCQLSYAHTCEHELGDKDCQNAFVYANIHELCKGYLLNSSDIFEDKSLDFETILATHNFDKIMLYKWSHDHEICDTCRGSGTKFIFPEGLQPCPECHGTGIVPRSFDQRNMYFAYEILGNDTGVLNETIKIIPDSIHLDKNHVLRSYGILQQNTCKVGIYTKYTKLGTIPLLPKIPIIESSTEILICTTITGDIVYIGPYAGLVEFLQIELWEDLDAKLASKRLSVFTKNTFNEKRITIPRAWTTEMLNATLYQDAMEYILKFIHTDQFYRISLLTAYVHQIKRLIIDDCIDLLSSEGMYQLALPNRDLLDAVKRNVKRYGLSSSITSNLAGRMLYDITAIMSNSPEDAANIEDRMLKTNIVAMFVVEYVLIGKSEELEKMLPH